MPIEQYQPRACDCDFCRSNQVLYLSDNNGTVSVDGKNSLISIKQGSKQAEFLCCFKCKEVMLVTYLFCSGLRGAINARLLDDFDKLKEQIIVSPKKLSANEKVSRWESAWLEVEFDNQDTYESSI